MYGFDDLIRGGRSGGQSDAPETAEPVGIEVPGGLDVERRRTALEAARDEPPRVVRPASADHDDRLDFVEQLVQRLLPVAGGLADRGDVADVGVRIALAHPPHDRLRLA